MAHVLVVDDDALARAVLADLVKGLGHEVSVAASGAQALDVLDKKAAALVITDILMPGMDGFELAQRVGERVNPPPVLLASGFFRGDAEAHAKARRIPVRGFLSKPVDAQILRVMVDDLISVKTTAKPAVTAGSRRPGADARADQWSGHSFLVGISGPFERVPPLRLLFLAHRVDADGAVVIERNEYAGRIVVRAGRVVHIEGLPGILRSLDPKLPDVRHLGKDIGAAIAAGHPVDQALSAVATGLGEVLAKQVSQRGGMVRFDPDCSPPAGSFPLPTPIPRIIAGGLKAGRAQTQVDRDWVPLAKLAVRVRIPDDSPETRWGLDATTMRVFRLAQSSVDVGHLLNEASSGDPARRADVLRALDLLYLLGLVVVNGGPLDRSEESAGKVVTHSGHTEEDPRIGRLRAALAVMEGVPPIDVLELGDRRMVSEDDLANAYREISKRFHPDTYFGAPPLVRALAEGCFSKVNGAYEALRAPGALAETKRLLEARTDGRAYVSDRDHQGARVAFKRAEVLYRNRDWRGADALFCEANRLDPTAWPHALAAARAGFLARRLTADEAVQELDAIQAPNAMKRAEIQVAVGNVLKLEGRPNDAAKRFKSAIEADPENRDAQREIRLQSGRGTGEKSVSTAGPSAPTSVLSGFLRRGTDGKK